MVYSTSRCPSCGKVIKRQTNPVHEIGDPFERCRWCGKNYLNSYKEEWITKSPFKRFFFFLQAGVWARAFLVPPLVFALLLSFLEIGVDILRIIWPIASIAWVVAGYFIHKKASQDDIYASVERTNNPVYLSLLQKAGYKIYPITGYTVSDSTKSTHSSLGEKKHEEKAQLDKERSSFCRKCGNKLAQDSLFCSKCGTKVITDDKRGE